MDKYNRAGAVEYARTWAFKRNPRYADFSKMGGDCTNFISQCLVAGGFAMDKNWFYYTLTRRSPSFSGVSFLYDFLLNKRHAKSAKLQDLDIGDIIQLSFDGANFTHSLLVVQSGDDPTIATHSNDAFARPLSTYTYKIARGINIVQR